MLNHRERFGIGLFAVAFFFLVVVCNESPAQGLPEEIPGLISFDLQDIDILSPSEHMGKAQTQDSSWQYRTTAQTRKEVRVSIDGVNHTLILEPHLLRSPDFRLFAYGADGRIREAVSPPPCTYRGVVEGDQNSQVTAAIADGKLNADIRLGSGDVWHVQPASAFLKSTSRSLHVLYRDIDVICPEGFCGVHDAPAVLFSQIASNVAGDTTTLSASDGACPVIKICEIALDADFEFYQKNGSSVSATLLDIETVMNGVAEIYERQTAITYEITEVIVRTTEEDPYTSTSADILLEAFRDQWSNNHADIHRDVAHLFTGKDLDGSTVGLAYLGSVCNTYDPYGLSESRFTDSLPLRIALTAHELGHNWDAPHCNSEPDCAIMCSQIGGCSGAVNEFCSSTISTIVTFRNTRPCLSDYIPYGGGCGTAESPYLILTAEHLAALVNHPADWDRHFRMMADIDLTDAGTDFGCIGNQDTPFSGAFDGNGYRISNFNLSVAEPVTGTGLFGWVEGSGAVITKLGLSNVAVSAESADRVGALVGQLTDGSVTRCYVAGGSISGNDQVGGLVGYNAGNVTDCYAGDAVSGRSNVGGFAGYNDGIVANCYSTGEVVGSTEIGIGGLIGNAGLGSVSASFWDTLTSGQLASPGGGTGKTTDLMKKEETFTSAGWDFTSPVWIIDDGIDYPRLFLLHDTVYGGGAGTDAYPFLIFTPEQLNNIGVNPNDWGRHFKLMTDVDLSSYTAEQFNIIGNTAKAFSGVFDGDGHAISDFNYESPNDLVGFFGVVDGASSEIRNLELSNPNVDAEGGTYVGSLVGELRSGIVSGCLIDGGSVSGKDNVGGLVGRKVNGTVVDCSANCAVTGTGSYVGGLVGLHYMGTIRDCSSTGEVAGNTMVGGLVGYNGSFFVNASSVLTSFAGGNVFAQSYAGGLTGFNEGTISQCYSTGDVEGAMTLGGLAGGNSGVVRFCFSSGWISETAVSSGGLVGTGEPDAVANSFWDTDTSHRLDSPGGGTARTNDLMKLQSTFASAGWDFVGETVNGTEYIWRLCQDGADYPRLAWQFLDADFVCLDGVDLADFGFFASRWLSSNCDESNGCDGTDLDDSGAVGAADLVVLAEHWLSPDAKD